MIYGLKTDQSGKKLKELESAYKPSEDEKEAYKMVQEDYSIGWDNLNKNIVELDNMSPVDRYYRDREAFYSVRPPRSNRPEESWKAQTIRPLTRNKCISYASHMAKLMMQPQAFAQNSRDEDDKTAAYVMRDFIDFALSSSSLKWERKAIQVMLSAITSPLAILDLDYVDAYRTERGDKDKSGKRTTKKVRDEETSGFQASVIPLDEMLFENNWESDVQKQRFVIRQRYISFATAKSIYGDSKNWSHVIDSHHSGARFEFSPAYESCFRVTDNLIKPNYLHEVRYYNRMEDLELVFVNGVLVTDADAPNRRNDKLYPFAISGFEPIEGNIYYISLVQKMSGDQELINDLYNMILDGSFLSLMPPTAIYGDEEFDSMIYIPGSSHAFDAETRVETLGARSDIRAGIEAASIVERSIDESSQRDRTSANQGTAYGIAQSEENAAKAIEFSVNFQRFMVEDFGRLLVNDILQHMTVSELGELTSDTLQYKTFLIRGDDKNTTNRRIEFTGFVDPSKVEEMSFDLLEKESKMKGSTKLFMVTPAFSKLKFKVRIDASQMKVVNERVEKALSLEAYDRLIQNPVIDQKKVTKDFLIDIYRPGEGDEYIKEEAPLPPGGGGAGQNPAEAQAQAQGERFQQAGVNTSVLSQITGSNSLTNALRDE